MPAMTDLGASNVQHHSTALLNYAVWARMCSDRAPPVPPPLADGAARFQALAPEQQATVARYAERCWRLVCDEATAAVHDPGHARVGLATLRRAMPHLDDWTADVLWNNAYRLAMQ